MFRYLAIRRVAALGTVFLLIVAVSVAAVFLLSTPAARGDGPLDWPPLTMVYEVDGLVYNGTTVKEVHQLVYDSKSDWTDTVIESDASQALGVSDIDPVGSYQRVENGRWERYTSFNGILDVDDEVGDNTIRVPNAYLAPIPISKIISPEERALLPKTSTTSTVCYNTQCKDNADGVLLEALGWPEQPIVDDPRWGISLKFQTRFKVRRLEIDAEPASH